MKGFPKHLNTRDDYLFVKDNFEYAMYSKVFQDLLDSEYDWFFVRQLDTDDNPVLTNNQKIEISTGETETRSLYEYRVNPTCKLLQIGFTHEEVVAILNAPHVGLATIGI